MLATRRARAIFLSSVLLGACSPYTRTTVVDVRDPTLVRYASEGTPLPVSSAGGAVVARHDVIYRDRFAELIVTAHATPNGSLVTSWSADPPIWNGERVIGIGNEGVITVPDHLAVGDAQTQGVTIPICGRYESFGARTGRARAPRATTVSLDVPCDGGQDLALTATTPWSNVRSVKYVSENDPAPKVVAAVVVAVLASVAGTTLLLARDAQGRSLSPAARDVGIGAFAVGGGIDLAILIPAFSSPSRERTVYEAKSQGSSKPL